MVAVDKILEIRMQGLALAGNAVRIFRVPTLTGSEKSLFDLLNANEVLHQPPLLRDVTFQDLKSRAAAESIGWGYPCHSQAVERMVTSITEASKRVAGFERRDSFVRAQLKSRQEMPKFAFL